MKLPIGRNLLLSALVLALSSAVASAATHTFNVTLTGAEETPPNGSTATGSGTVLFDDIANTVAVNILFSGLTGGNATLSHIHRGPPGPPAGPVIVNFTPFTPSATSGSIVATLGFPVPDIGNLFAGNTYYNIHNNGFPGGEIRGQLILVPEPSTAALFGLGVIGMAIRGWRKRSRIA